MPFSSFKGSFRRFFLGSICVRLLRMVNIWSFFRIRIPHNFLRLTLYPLESIGTTHYREVLWMDANIRQEMALFRYSLIAPLLTETFTQRSAKEYLEEVSAKKHQTPQGLKEFAPATLKEWLRLYRRYGIDGLYPKIRSDKGKTRKLSPEAKAFITECKTNFTRRTAKSIYHELIAKGFLNSHQISLSTVQRYLSKVETLPKEDVVERRAFEFEFPNDCWQSDISVGPYITVNGRKHKTYMIAVLDDASRLIIHCEAFFTENLLALLNVFKKGVAKRGIPKKLLVDNGKVYRSGQMQFICASLGTILCFTRIFSPQSKGKIERWFRTLQDQWLNITDWSSFRSLEELNEALSIYVEQQYNQKTHSAIKEKPIDKFIRHVDRIRFVESKQQLDYIFLYRVTRTVKNDATISLDNVIFEVPFQYVGEKIHVRYDPTSFEKAYIFSEEGRMIKTITPVNKIDNTKVRRSQNVKPVDFSAFTPVN